MCPAHRKRIPVKRVIRFLCQRCPSNVFSACCLFHGMSVLRGRCLLGVKWVCGWLEGWFGLRGVVESEWRVESEQWH